MVWIVATTPEPITFRGDTLGIEVPLDVVGPALFGGFCLAAVGWAVPDLRRGRRPGRLPWTRPELRVVAAFVGALPVQFLLLRLGQAHGTTDQIGVVLILAQWFLLGVALRPRR